MKELIIMDKHSWAKRYAITVINFSSGTKQGLFKWILCLCMTFFLPIFGEDTWHKWNIKWKERDQRLS
jgi:hypothetical protein